VKRIHAPLERRALLGGIAIITVMLYVVMRNSSWVYDDNYWLVRAGQEGFNWHWLNTPQYEHWDIGLNAVFSLQHLLFFFDYRWGLAALLLVLGGAIYIFENAIAMIVSRRWVAVAAAVWFGASVLWARPLQWWDAGVQYFPYTFFDLLCLYGFLRYYADGRRNRWAVISAAALAAALLFYEKPAYMLVYLLLFRVLLMSEDLRPRTILADLWCERRVWGAYLLVVGIWAIGYINSGAYVTTKGSVSLIEYLTYFKIFWVQTLVPALFSLTIPASKLSGAQTLFVVVAQVGVVTALVVSLLRKSSAWRAWAFLAIAILVTGGLVAHSRIYQFGVSIANDPRYLIDFAWLVPLSACAAFSRDRIVWPRVPTKTAGAALPSGRVLVPVLACLLLYFAVATASAIHLEAIWGGPQARIWETNVRRDIASLRRSQGDLVVANNATPFVIMEEFIAPYNRLSRVLPLYVGPIQVDGPLDGRLVRLDEDGVAHLAAFTSPMGSVATQELIKSHALDVGPGGREIVNGNDICVVADATPVTVERNAIPYPAKAGPYYLRLEYHVWRPLELPLFVDAGKGYSAEPLSTVRLSPGASNSIAWLGQGIPHRLMVTVPPLNTVCIAGVEVASLRDIS